MSDPNFAPAERRSYLIPMVVALAALAVAVLLGIHFFPATTVNIAHVHADILATSTRYKSQSIVVGEDHVESQLFIAETLKIDNQLRTPIFLNDFILTITDEHGAELSARALDKADLDAVETSFPKVVPLTATLLPRETSIDPGKSVQGTVIFSVRLPQSIWEARRSAVVKVDLYHQNPVYQTIPKS